MKEFLLAQCKRQHCETLDDFYAAIGYGGIILSRIMTRIKEDYQRLIKAENIQPEKLVTVTRTRHNNGEVYRKYG